MLLATLLCTGLQVSLGLNLSPFISEGADVRPLSLVGPIPGIDFPSYSGLISTNTSVNAEAFFWYWPALNGNSSAPLLVWLQGGPGSSSLFGMLVEMGPYRIDASFNPVLNPDTWTKEYQMVFLDNPRGTGFSSADVLCTNWECYGADFDSFIRQFLKAYNLLGVDLYITGGAYFILFLSLSQV